MIDPIIGRVGLLTYLASLITDLLIMVMLDLEMMNFGLEVAIKQRTRCVRMELFSRVSKVRSIEGIVQYGE